MLLDSVKRGPGHGLLSTRPKKPSYSLTTNLAGASGAGCGQTDFPPPIPNQPRPVPQPDDGARQMYNMMQRQTDITELFARNQQLFRLPKRDVPVFQGDPLEFRSFIRAFIHAIDSRAESNADKLYFLEQYPRGEARDLVRSCQHMPDHHGYEKALRLLQEKY